MDETYIVYMTYIMYDRTTYNTYITYKTYITYVRTTYKTYISYITYIAFDWRRSRHRRRDGVQAGRP